MFFPSVNVSILLTFIIIINICCNGDVFSCVEASSQPALDPPAMDKSILLNDRNNATCLVLAQTDMYTSAGTGRWTPQPQTKCVHRGLTITSRVVDTTKTSFTVTITGRHLVCSDSHWKVAMRQTKWPQCETAGRYRTCKLTRATGSGDGELTSCVATCKCDGKDCKHVTVHIPMRQDSWEICEIDIK